MIESETNADSIIPCDFQSIPIEELGKLPGDNVTIWNINPEGYSETIISRAQLLQLLFTVWDPAKQYEDAEF